MIRGVIFDCFDVLVRGSLDYFLSLTPPEKRRIISDYNQAADYGYIPEADYVAKLAEVLEKPVSEIRTLMSQRHIVDRDMLELVRSLRGRFKLGMLSNASSKKVMTEFFSPEQLSWFDAIIVSGEEHITKPAPEIFTLTAERLGLAPDECVMIDDKPYNVEGASLVGMKGIVASTAAQVEEELRNVIGREHA